MQITLEGHDRAVTAQAGDTLLAALLRAGLAFPFSCQTGSCGTCKCQLVSGEVHDLAYSEHTLSLSERARGIVLACRSELRGDAVIRRID
jgi:toluene monooxygenase electron transfer component